MRRFQITEVEYEAIKAKEAVTKDKNISRRLRALILWYEGKSLKQIGEILSVHPMSVNQMCKRYREQGLEEYARNKYTSHWRLLSEEEEAEILDQGLRHCRKRHPVSAEGRPEPEAPVHLLPDRHDRDPHLYPEQYSGGAP